MMEAITLAKSPRAQAALSMLTKVQRSFAEQLSSLHAEPRYPFLPVEWHRNHGTWGGGLRLMAQDDSGVFNRASVNFSQVQYEAEPTKKLDSATALSTIVHPRAPSSPSVHIHVSYTEHKNGQAYWRLMADLNPSHFSPAETAHFITPFMEWGRTEFAEALFAGDRYFYIPALGRYRGSVHLYLEGYESGDSKADLDFAERFATTAIDSYCAVLKHSLHDPRTLDSAAAKRQVEYHSLYFLQVLTLDRGTTVGLLVHEDNDLGVMASLPRIVNRRCLQDWMVLHPPLQQNLLAVLLACFVGNEEEVLVDDACKLRLARAIREFYRTYPEALELQAP